MDKNTLGIVVILGGWVAMMGLFFALSRWKRFACKIGWHSITSGFEDMYHDGCSQHARCKWCGYEGMIDSQGNLF